MAICMFEELRRKNIDEDILGDYVDKIKRDVRKWSRKDNTAQEWNGKYVTRHRGIKDYGIDGYIELVELPDEIEDVETAEEFFRTFLYMRCRPSMFDCTGDMFTSWFKCFKRHGKYFAYHSIAMDV